MVLVSEADAVRRDRGHLRARPDLDPELLELRRCALGEVVREGWENAGARLEQPDLRLRRIDVAEVPIENELGQLRQRTRELDPRRPTADDDEAEELLSHRRDPVSRSASSKASSTRRRISTASSIDLSPGAAFAQASWPKYDVCAPQATMRKSHSR